MQFCKFLSEGETAALTVASSFHVDEICEQEIVRRRGEFAVCNTTRAQ